MFTGKMNFSSKMIPGGLLFWFLKNLHTQFLRRDLFIKIEQLKNQLFKNFVFMKNKNIYWRLIH